MATSSITGVDEATPIRDDDDTERLGPSDTSDSGSDSIGLNVHDSDSGGSGEGIDATGGEPRSGADILPDRIVGIDGEEEAPDGERLAAYEDVAADEDADELEGDSASGELADEDDEG